MNNIKRINVVTDCDEVLTDISPLWVKKIWENREYFGRFFNIPETFDHENTDDYKKVLSRPEFHLNKWLLKDDLQLSEEEEKELFEKFYSLYDNDDFYSECIPTKMCEGIHKMIGRKDVEKIYVVTRTSDGTRKSKEHFLRTHLNSDKVEIIFVGRNEKKSDYINKLDNVKMIVEDELSNIHDILDNCPAITEADLYVPYTGYNDPDADLFDKADEKKVKLIYYPIFQVDGAEVKVS